MAKRTITFDNYKEQDWEEYTGDDPKPGMWLNAECVRARYLEDDDQIVFYFTVVDHPDYAGWTRGVYCPLDDSDTRYFVTQETLKALQGGVTKNVTLDWENETAVANWLKKAKKVRVQTEEYAERIRIRKARALLASVPNGTTAKAKAAAPAPEPEPDDTDDEQLEDYTQDELEALSLDDLKAILAEEFAGTTVPAKGRRDSEDKYKEKLIDAILDAQEAEGEDDGEEGDDPEFEDGFEDAPEEEAEPEPEPEPAPRRRTRAAAAPAAKAAPAPAAGRRRRS